MFSHKSYLQKLLQHTILKKKNSRADDEQNHFHVSGGNGAYFELYTHPKNINEDDFVFHLRDFIENKDWFDENDALMDSGKEKLNDIISKYQIQPSYIQWCLKYLRILSRTFKKKKKSELISDEEIELKPSSHSTFCDNKNPKEEELEELKASVTDYFTQIEKFYNLRLSQYDAIKLRIFLRQKLHLPSMISTLEAINHDILNLLQRSKQIDIKCDQLLKSLDKCQKEVTEIKEKILIKTSKFNKSNNDILRLIEKGKLYQTTDYQKQLEIDEVANTEIIEMMTTITDYVMKKDNFHRFDGNAKSNYLRDAYHNWLDQRENKELGGKNYDIEDVISAFKVFLICCLQNKSRSNSCFGGLFKSKTTTTGKCILNLFKDELINILYRDSVVPINLDYEKLANDLLVDKNNLLTSNSENVCEKAKALISHYNHNEPTKLTIKEWKQPVAKR